MEKEKVGKHFRKISSCPFIENGNMLFVRTVFEMLNISKNEIEKRIRRRKSRNPFHDFANAHVQPLQSN
jgi:hypothetical protein